MSYYDDWIAPYYVDEDYIIEQQERQQEIENNRHIGWTTKDGDLIPYSKMTISHIKNCIRMIKRENIRKIFLPYLLTELKRRGCNWQG